MWIRSSLFTVMLIRIRIRIFKVMRISDLWSLRLHCKRPRPSVTPLEPLKLMNFIDLNVGFDSASSFQILCRSGSTFDIPGLYNWNQSSELGFHLILSYVFNADLVARCELNADTCRSWYARIRLHLVHPDTSSTNLDPVLDSEAQNASCRQKHVKSGLNLPSV